MLYVLALGPTEQPAAAADAPPPHERPNRSQEFTEERKKRVLLILCYVTESENDFCTLCVQAEQDVLPSLVISRACIQR